MSFGICRILSVGSDFKDLPSDSDSVGFCGGEGIYTIYIIALYIQTIIHF